MELTSALESYLLDSRQIDRLAVRQARVIGAGIAGSGRESEATGIVLLLLAALHRGAPRAGRNDLLLPVSAATISFHAHTVRGNNVSDASWEQELTADETFFTTAVDRLFTNPLRLQPLSGPQPSSNSEQWPILVVGKEFAGFSRPMYAASVLENVHLPRLLDDKEAPPAPATVAAALHRVFVDEPVLQEGTRAHCRQVAAAALACRSRFCIVSGGPGTGKTTVVLQILRTLLDVFPVISVDGIALCAPTGRAKARLVESLGTGLDMLDSGTATHRVTAKTIQGLLVQQSDGSFRYHRDNRLPYQVVVVDEASMMDINLFAALMEAISDECRLILVGDMHQLPSVEAGAPLGDLTECFSGLEHAPTLSTAIGEWLDEATNSIPMDERDELQRMFLDTASEAAVKTGRLADHVVILTKSYRSSGAIIELSKAVNCGNAERAISLCNDARTAESLQFTTTDGTAVITARLAHHFGRTDVRQAFSVLRATRTVDPEAPEVLDAAKTILFISVVLTLAHEGPRGRQAVNIMAEKQLRNAMRIPDGERFFSGLPVILGANHHNLDLYNGDLGIVIATSRGLKVFFPRGPSFRLASPDRLRNLEPAFALTVHKSQGSEFGNVLLVLPEHNSPLLSRQIVYTGITRAKQQVTVLGSEATFRTAIDHREQREGGVRIEQMP